MPFDATPVTSPTIERLRRGLALVSRPDGWCRGATYAGDRFCARGAIWSSDPTDPSYVQALRYLRIATGGTTKGANEPLDRQDVERWNDADGREQHEVIALFAAGIEEAVADKLREGS